MHPALEELTPREAFDLISSPLLMQQWIERHGAPYREAAEVIFDKFEAALDEPPAAGDPRRHDTARLRELIERAEGLPLRLRQVGHLCLEEGLSLRQCAERLGISRETVRVHLRRLRAIARRLDAARASHGAAER